MTDKSMTPQVSQKLREQGYIPLAEVRALLSRIGSRMSELDEPLAREYVIAAQGGIEQKIHQMCQRRKLLFSKLAEHELQAESSRAADAD